MINVVIFGLPLFCRVGFPSWRIHTLERLAEVTAFFAALGRAVIAVAGLIGTFVLSFLILVL